MQYDAVGSSAGETGAFAEGKQGTGSMHSGPAAYSPRVLIDTRSFVAGDAAGGRGRKSSMVVASPRATVSGVTGHEHASLGERAAVSASIARYNLAAERTLMLSNFLGIVAVGVIVLTAIAWLLGWLPGSVRLF